MPSAVQDAKKASRGLWALLVLGVGAVAAAYAALIFVGGPGARPGIEVKENLPAPSGSLADYGAVPPFSLTEAGGRIVTLADLAGSIWVADFIFTRCAGSCPMMTSRMASLSRSLEARSDIKLVSFTVDPERDSVDVLSKYAKLAGADPGQWLFLTGAKDALHGLARNGFHLGVEEQAEDGAEPILHSTRLILIDRTGRIRGYYDATDETALERLTADLKGLP